MFPDWLRVRRGVGCGCSPCRLLPLVLVQVGGGEVCGRTTGAKALFCLTAEIIWTGENEKGPAEREMEVGMHEEEEEEAWCSNRGLEGVTETDTHTETHAHTRTHRDESYEVGHADC